ncbi:hypothetical protein TNIN_150381 [Trichonephila inaurata madagascariensis]|uniref:Reverse transcriptase domain-containing protein n=1 Tax=Trichonephila inaurata madagascariensis TaxID=2747483 RepID=A0A8X7C2H7_9ARAC|nr:hypothetical protein TNIN_150381 [Trichonephila inaurata madagascariensis]
MITGVRCLRYADDLVIWTESSKKQAAQLINHGLNLALKVLGRWCDENNMKVNLDKTVSVIYILFDTSTLAYRSVISRACDPGSR